MPQCLPLEGEEGADSEEREDSSQEDPKEIITLAFVSENTGVMASSPDELRGLSLAHGLRASRNITSPPHAPPPLAGLTGLSLSNSMAVRRAAQRYGLREGGETNDWTLYWTDYSVSLERVLEMKSYQPFIIDGFKFDLRIYVLMTSCDPLRIFAYNEGLARFATTSYSHPSIDNLDDICMHLTNYSINKHSSNFIRDAHAGSKR
uniref:Tubulin tyrosine ligase like 6 n=1 Tax=Ursus maritimus TaxID=29073 RepID=A0A452UKW0_URSMA